MKSDPAPVARIVRFGACEVDLTAGELRKSGVKIRVQGQPFEVLAMLLERPGQLVTRERLRERLWPTDTFVDFDHGVNTAINKLREALGDSADAPRFIETVPRRGYRFIGAVEVGSPTPRAASLPSFGPLLIWVPVLIVVAITAAATIGYFSWRHSRPHAQALTGPIMLAVLPFENLSGDPREEFFSDGMTEEMIMQLGRLHPEQLGVIARTSSMPYKNSHKSIAQISKELSVRYLVEGTVRRSGERVRIDARLIRAGDQSTLWNESYDAELRDVLVLQGEIAQQIAEGIQIKLDPQEQARLAHPRPVDPRAHDAYLRGLYAWYKGTEPDIEQAIHDFLQAIEIDPNYALAYAGLADCYNNWWPGGPSPREMMPKAREAAQHALQLDSSLAEAHASLGGIALLYDWDWSAAERELKTAIALNPSYTSAHETYGRELVALGRREEAIAEVQRALQVDPLALYITDYPAWVCYLAHRYDLSVDYAQRMLNANNPEISWAHYDLGLNYEQTGRREDAVREFLRAKELWGDSPRSIEELRRALEQGGVRGYWEKDLELGKLPNTHGYFSAGMAAATCARLGKRDEMFALLEKAFEQRDDLLVNLDADPLFDPYRSDPRFHDLLRRIGLPQ